MRAFKFIFLLSLTLLVACSQEPAEIHYGSDECAQCKMMITDNRFATQIVTSKGRAIKFDAIECLTAYRRQHNDELEGAKLWVSNFGSPGEWLPAQEALYVQSEVINSPMGASLLALPSMQKAKSHIGKNPGTLLNWEEVAEIKPKM